MDATSPQVIVKPPRPITRKQQAFVKHMVDNPKDSATQAAAIAYNVSNRHTAQTIAAENLAKPVIRTELAKYSGMLESALINTVDEWKDHEKPRQREIAMNVAMYAHDKIHGKATQRVETQSTAVQININLTNDQAPTD